MPSRRSRPARSRATSSTASCVRTQSDELSRSAAIGRAICNDMFPSQGAAPKPAPGTLSGGFSRPGNAPKRLSPCRAAFNRPALSRENPQRALERSSSGILRADVLSRRSPSRIASSRKRPTTAFSGAPARPYQLFASTRPPRLLLALIDSWCERRCLRPLGPLLQAWPLNGLSDGAHELLRALRLARAACEDATLFESELLSAVESKLSAQLNTV